MLFEIGEFFGNFAIGITAACNVLENEGTVWIALVCCYVTRTYDNIYIVRVVVNTPIPVVYRL
jgi:hypothetical protein